MTVNIRQGSALHTSSIQPKNLQDVVLQHRPAKPLYVVFPDKIRQAAQDFCAIFPGKALYAVKTNPDPQVIRAMKQGGVKGFDVASLEEIRLVRQMAPRAELHFMHPVKMPEDIRAAYFEYGVRNFVLDHEDELFKIMRETDLAQDLNLTVRIALPKTDKALIDFSGKFGATMAEAIDLLNKCRPVSQKLGLSFHVGTQMSDPAVYARAISYAADIISACGVKVDTLNIGGGFPVAYEGDENLQSLGDYMQDIKTALIKSGLGKIKLLAEPGRVLVAKGAALVARVELRKGDMLYINDGVYGGLFDAADWVGTQYPVQAVSCDRPFTAETRAFQMSGPTCDSLDMMKGPFVLPGDIGIGDWIVFENTGAYSMALRSNFNGFGHADTVYIQDRRSSKSL